MQRVRRLYEDGVVPAREIARLAGVTERTLYKYVRKGKWRRRYARRALTKGAGGRFIPREDAGKPFVRGIKAADPAGRARAAKDCARAQRLARHSAKEAAARQAVRARYKAIDAINAALYEAAKWIVATQKDAAAAARAAPLQHRMLDLIGRMQESFFSSPVGRGERGLAATPAIP